MQKETFIDKLDAFFLSKKNSEVLMYFILTFLIIVLFVYYFIFPLSEDFFSKKTRSLNDTNSRLSVATNYIATNQNRPAILESEINSASQKLIDTRTTNSYIDYKLKELSYLLFNDKSWASFMDRITFLAKKYNISIVKIENDFTDEKNQTREKVEQVLNVNIQFSGSFSGAMKFINALEESQLVVDANALNLIGTQNNGVDGNISISIWGMLY